ncbi:hypothetical protein [uncultured Roseobacter sp.]|uniref:hypothetical protein n=1 Tax=uncultured Roseobacter sp. TaxID=114847 RepID=UPI002624BA9C|nr:hypothetical protein [uncultured Roseobacter sp.]
MMSVRYFFCGFCAALLASVVQAQTVPEPPRFDGSRSTASSSRVINPADPQYGLQGQGGPLPRALIGAAALEAAREEGRHFIEERRQDAAQPEDD